MTTPTVKVNVIDAGTVDLRVSIPVIEKASAPTSTTEVPDRGKWSPDAALKRLNAIEPNLQRFDGARLKIERMGTSGQFNPSLCVEISSGLGADIMDIRGDVQALREMLTDAGLI